MILLFAAACGLIVANIYYSQPLIGLIAPSVGLPPGAASLIVTVTQFGYCAGLVFLVPLGDLVENRRLVLWTLGGAILALSLVTTATSPVGVLAATALLGLGSVVVQMLVPMAAHVANDANRGRVVGNVMSGLLVGIMLSRPVAGFVANVWGWRTVFGASAVVMTMLALVLSRSLPARRPESTQSYGELIGSLWTLFRDTALLRRRALYQAALFGAFSLFWTAVPLQLAGPAFGLSQSGIAWFSLAGVAGALAAPLAGRLADRGLTRLATSVAMAIAAAAFFVSRLDQGRSLVLLLAGAVLLDFGVQANLVLGQREIYAIGAHLRSRLNGLYMAVFFIGGAAGSSIASMAMQRGGWETVSWIGMGLPVAAWVYHMTEVRAARPAVWILAAIVLAASPMAEAAVAAAAAATTVTATAISAPAVPGPPTGLADSAALRATVFGTPPEDIAPLPAEVPLIEINLPMPWAQTIPRIFWFDRKLRVWFSAQKGPAPLAIVIAGTGGDGNTSSLATLRAALYGAGYHVLTVPSPTFPGFIVAASRTGVAGDLLQDGRDLYDSLQQIVAHLPRKVRITDVDVVGYSLGGANAGIVKSIDTRERKLHIHRAVMIEPPVSLFDSMGRLDELFAESIGSGNDGIERLYQRLFVQLANFYRASDRVDIDESFLLSGAAAVLKTDREFSAAIALAFRLDLMNVFFAGDLYARTGVIIDPRHPPTVGEPLESIEQTLRTKTFSEYFTRVFAPYYLAHRPHSTVASLVAENRLDIIGDALRTDPDYYAQTNRDDLILDRADLDWLQATFAGRIAVYDHGGHLGNLGDRRQIADMLAMLAGRWRGSQP